MKPPYDEGPLTKHQRYAQTGNPGYAHGGHVDMHEHHSSGHTGGHSSMKHHEHKGHGKHGHKGPHEHHTSPGHHTKGGGMKHHSDGHHYTPTDGHVGHDGHSVHSLVHEGKNTPEHTMTTHTEHIETDGGGGKHHQGGEMLAPGTGGTRNRV